MITFTLPWPPSNNTYKRHFCTKQVNARGDHIVSAYLTDRATQFKKDAGMLAKAAGVRMMDGPIRLQLDAYPPKQNTDLDNLPKAIQDALNGIAYEDDKQICVLTIIRHEKSGPARVEVQIGGV